MEQNQQKGLTKRKTAMYFRTGTQTSKLRKQRANEIKILEWREVIGSASGIGAAARLPEQTGEGDADIRRPVKREMDDKVSAADFAP